MRWGRGPSAATQPVPERRRWVRLSLAIPVFVRGVNGQGKEFLEFCTLLNESAGGALLAMRKPLRRRSRISNDAYAEGAHGSSLADRWLESVWITICPATYLEQAKKGIDIPFNLF